MKDRESVGEICKPEPDLTGTEKPEERHPNMENTVLEKKMNGTRKIIDCHCHIYPEKIAARAVAGIGNFYHINMRYDGTLNTLLRVGGEAGIDRHIVFSVATKPSQTLPINQFIAAEVAAYPDRLIGLGTLHPESDDLRADLDALRSLGLRGVKLHPDVQGFRLDDSRCLEIYRMCGGKIPVLIHTGDSRYDFSNPNRMKPVLDRYPDLTVIGAHLGGWSIWRDAVKTLAGYPNFYVDCSSSLYALTPGEARDVIRTYGADHVLFGTDYPMWSPKEELERLYALNLDDEELDLILYGNAQRLFGIR